MSITIRRMRSGDAEALYRLCGRNQKEAENGQHASI